MKLENIVNDLYPKIIDWRRDFHKYAESGWVEIRSASIVAETLTQLGYEVSCGKDVIKAESRMGVPSDEFLAEQKKRAMEQGAIEQWVDSLADGFTGVVGVLDSGKPGPTVGLRFDMDALDIQESMDDSHVPYNNGFSSINQNKMHACGHDAHTAIGLAVATVVMEMKDQVKGKVKLIFQPSEEGVRGAKSMVDAGVLDDVDIFLGSHVGVGPELGEVVCGTSGFLATTKADVHFYGKASHAGVNPEEGKNALLAAASAALNLHAIPRHSQGSSRINVGVIQAGTGRNIIPHYAQLKFETRGETSEINEFIFEQAQRILQGASNMYDVKMNMDIVGEAKGAASDKELTKYIREKAESISYIKKISYEINMAGSDDATYMMSRVQENGGLASYLIFGTTLAAGHHNEKFDIDEKVMQIGVKTLVASILDASDVYSIT